MSSSYKKGGGRGSRSRSRSDHSSTRGGAPALTKNLKKRKHEEISTETAHHAPAQDPEEKDKLWVDKYAPKCLEDMIVQDKKVQEFSTIMQNEKVKILLMTGPPGCGKNSLINLYC